MKIFKNKKLNTNDKIEVAFYNERIIEKPNKEDTFTYGKITNYFKGLEEIPTYTISEVKEKLGNCFPICPSGIRGDEKDWKGQQIFCIDFDNEKEDEYISSQEFIEKTKEENIEPNFIYYTLSSTNEKEKYRAVYILEEKITNIKDAKKFLDLLFNKLKKYNPDESKHGIKDMFLGGTNVVDICDYYYKFESQKDIFDLNDLDVIYEDEEEDNKYYCQELDKTFILPLGFYINQENGRLYGTNSRGNPIIISNSEVFITSIEKDIENKDEKFTISFKNKYGKFEDITIQKSDLLYGRGVNELTNKGLIIPYGASKVFLNYISNFEIENLDILETKYTTQQLGWNNGEFVPFNEGGKISMDLVETQFLNMYEGIRENGEFDIWLELMKKCRKNDVFRGVINSSFASPLLYLLEQRSFMFYNWCESGSGKTAALKCGASIWGNPNDLLVTLNSTNVGIERLLTFINNFPLFVDEKQINNSQKQLESLIYMISNGVGRVRGAKIGGLQKIGKWNSVVLLTGEETIETETTNNGVANRIVEIFGTPFDNKKEVPKIYETINKNYGFGGKIFMKNLIDEYSQNDYKELNKLFNNIKEKLMGIIPLSFQNHLQYVGILVLADILAERYIFKNYNEDESFDFGLRLVNLLPRFDKINLIDQQYDYVVNWIASNKDYIKVLDKNGDIAISNNNYSKSKTIGLKQSKLYYIFSSYLMDLCRKKGWNYRSLLTNFSTKGYIVQRENGEHTTLKKYNGVASRCVVFNIEDEEFTKKEQQNEEDFEKKEKERETSLDEKMREYEEKGIDAL